MSLTLKLTSLGIRTIAKPIGNLIKRQAREHEGFKHFCIRFAQGLHRVDARMRLGLLEDSEAITRQIEREAASVEAKRLRSQSRPQSSTPTVKTEQQAKADEEARQKERRFIEEKVKNDEKKKGARMFKPLSEGKAIDTGANFASEAFVFLIGAGLVIFENWRSRRKESTRREDVKERLEWLEERVKVSQEENSTLEHHVESLTEQLEHLKTANATKSPVETNAPHNSNQDTTKTAEADKSSTAPESASEKSPQTKESKE